MQHWLFNKTNSNQNVNVFSQKHNALISEAPTFYPTCPPQSSKARPDIYYGLFGLDHLSPTAPTLGAYSTLCTTCREIRVGDITIILYTIELYSTREVCIVWFSVKKVCKALARATRKVRMLEIIVPEHSLAGVIFTTYLDCLVRCARAMTFGVVHPTNSSSESPPATSQHSRVSHEHCLHSAAHSAISPAPHQIWPRVQINNIKVKRCVAVAILWFSGTDDEVSRSTPLKCTPTHTLNAGRHAFQQHSVEIYSAAATEWRNMAPKQDGLICKQRANANW